jgi:gliding motility-associated-like protein
VHFERFGLKESYNFIATQKINYLENSTLNKLLVVFSFLALLLGMMPQKVYAFQSESLNVNLIADTIKQANESQNIQAPQYTYNVDFKYDTACLGDTTRLINISTSDDTVLSVYWDLNTDGVFDDAYTDTVKLVFSGSGFWPIGMRIIYQSGATQVKYHQVPVGVYPEIKFSYEGICSPNSTTSFTDSSTVAFGDIDQRFWDYGDGNSEYRTNNLAYHDYSPGTFDVKLAVTSTYGCKDTLTKAITVYQNPDVVLLNKDNSEVFFNDTVKFAKGDSAYLQIADAANYDSIIWPGNIKANDYYLKEEGNFSVKVYKNICLGFTDFIGYFLSNSSAGFSVMSLITPNGDGFNDKWVVSSDAIIEPVEVWIYNRTGSLVYHAVPYNNDWSGTYNGNPLPGGTYYFVMKDAAGKQFKGNVLILR